MVELVRRNPRYDVISVDHAVILGIDLHALWSIWTP
jgi:hypothetical protein